MSRWLLYSVLRLRSLSISHELLDSKEISATIGNGNDDSMKDMLLSSRELADCKLVLQTPFTGEWKVYLFVKQYARDLHDLVTLLLRNR